MGQTTALVVTATLLLVGGVLLWAACRARGLFCRTKLLPQDPLARPVLRPTLRSEESQGVFGSRIGSMLRRSQLDELFWADLKDSLVASDMGVAVTERIIAKVRQQVPRDVASVRAALGQELAVLFAGVDRSLNRTTSPAVFLVVGANGAGKTTSIAKLAALLHREGARVLLGSADTFRAAADRQLRAWATRIGVDIVTGQEGADPAAVAYDTLQSARARGHDVVMIDTAGRLHTQTNLMDEIGKIARVLKGDMERIHEVLLVIDGISGQNGLIQAEMFMSVLDVTGIVLTKLDSSARGGIVVAIEGELGIPVKYVGVGEDVGDLVPFDPNAFVGALLG